MRTRHDQFAKQMVQAALKDRGTINTEAEVTADTRRIDLWFMPDAAHESQSDHLGMLGRIASHPSTLEFFHNTPEGHDLASCLIKHGEFRHFLARRKTPSPPPLQWVISSGRPTAGINGLWLRPSVDWPRGFYDAPPLLWTRLVVVKELPVARDTLLMRLLGAGTVLKRAIAELQALPHDAPEFTLAMPILVRSRLTVPSDPDKQTPDDKEFLMDTQDIVESFRREAIQEGFRQGEQRGEHRGLRKALLAIYEARFGEMPADLRQVVDSVEDESTLSAWHLLACTHSVGEIAAAIRAARAS